MLPVPQGGWLGADDRRRDYGGPHLSYLGELKLFPDADPVASSRQSFYPQSTCQTDDSLFLGEVRDSESIELTCGESWIALDEATGTLSIMKHVLGPLEVEYCFLSPAEKRIFAKSRYKVMESLFDLGAYRLLHLPESHRLWRLHPELVLLPQWVERWRATNSKDLLARDRFVILGFTDPSVYQLDRSGHTLTNEGYSCIMQTLASYGYPAVSSDIADAPQPEKRFMGSLGPVG